MSAIFGLYYARPHLPEIVQIYASLVKSGWPEVLHHYSSASGAVGILSSRTLWATNANYLNDAVELSYGLDVVRTVLADRFAIATGPTRSWITQVGRLVDDLIAGNSVYMACFCETNDLLSQWRGYGTDSGIAVTFDTAALGSDARNLLLRVLYEPAVQRQLVVETLAVYEEQVSEAISSADDFAPFRENSKLGVALGLLVVSFKHPTFAEEREWRILPLELPAVMFRVDNGWVKPYVELALPGGDRLSAVRAVTIGPGRHALLSRQSLLMLLSERGYRGVQVDISQVPLR